jgi:hypothetical protein
VLPSLLIMGVGMGMIFAPSMNNATLGVSASDSGVASATVSASQQVGGSVGVALLSTITASAVSSYLATAAHPVTQSVAAAASVHGYTTAFVWAAGIFALGAVAAAGLFRPGVRAMDHSAEPVLAH